MGSKLNKMNIPILSKAIFVLMLLGIAVYAYISAFFDKQVYFNSISNPFVVLLRSYPWHEFTKAFKNKRESVKGFQDLGEELLLLLLPYLTLPPKVPLNESCVAPPLGKPECQLLPTPRKYGMLFAHGLDADTLEILFHEMDRVTDRFFILESTITYYLGVDKPLIWERLRTQERFKQFVNKTLHFVVDGSDMFYNYEKESPNAPYIFQLLQEILLWRKFQDWNRRHNDYFSDSDLLSFSDLDEVPSADTVHHLKHCNITEWPINAGIWFPFGNINRAFNGSCPEGNNPEKYKFCFAAPTFWTLGQIKKEDPEDQNYDQYFFRRRSGTTKYMLGGMHMSGYNYIPFKLAKLVTIIESFHTVEGNRNANLLERITAVLAADISDENVLVLLQNILSEVSDAEKENIVNLKTLEKNFTESFNTLVKTPWFLDCNKDRYPSWHGELDTRLKIYR